MITIEKDCTTTMGGFITTVETTFFVLAAPRNMLEGVDLKTDGGTLVLVSVEGLLSGDDKGSLLLLFEVHT